MLWPQPFNTLACQLTGGGLKDECFVLCHTGEICHWDGVAWTVLRAIEKPGPVAPTPMGAEQRIAELEPSIVDVSPLPPQVHVNAGTVNARRFDRNGGTERAVCRLFSPQLTPFSAPLLPLPNQSLLRLWRHLQAFRNFDDPAWPWE
jgi:hypothetical protein